MKFFSMYLEIELGFPSVKEYVCRAGDLGLIPGLGRSPGEENGLLFLPEEPGGLTVPEVPKSGKWLSNQHFHLGTALLSLENTCF